mmetsp:Transcript_61856/g.70952  ORF Transcript_61856/g.70952 Transcript_61856/m.70952 type:complete len:107 (+) Transcript_61856:145-465(+)
MVRGSLSTRRYTISHHAEKISFRTKVFQLMAKENLLQPSALIAIMLVSMYLTGFITNALFVVGCGALKLISPFSIMSCHSISQVVQTQKVELSCLIFQHHGLCQQC